MQSVIRFTAISLCLLASAAQAQNGRTWATLDEWTLEIHNDNYATVEYYNADPPASFAFPRFLNVEDFTVGLYLHIGANGGPETLDVFAPDGWIAVPASISVEDGQIGVVQLFRGDYQGM